MDIQCIADFVDGRDLRAAFSIQKCVDGGGGQVGPFCQFVVGYIFPGAEIPDAG